MRSPESPSIYFTPRSTAWDISQEEEEEREEGGEGHKSLVTQTFRNLKPMNAWMHQLERRTTFQKPSNNPRVWGIDLLKDHSFFQSVGMDRLGPLDNTLIHPSCTPYISPPGWVAAHQERRLHSSAPCHARKGTGAHSPGWITIWITSLSSHHFHSPRMFLEAFFGGTGGFFGEYLKLGHKPNDARCGNDPAANCDD